MTIISSDHDNEIQFFRNNLPCQLILKMIRFNKWFNPPDERIWFRYPKVSFILSLNIGLNILHFVFVIRATDYSSRAPQGKGKKSKAPTPPPPESSDEDDLIVVRTDYNTVDPISKKEIVEPVKNKKCNHIYEKSTIYSMIDLARENNKPVFIYIYLLSIYQSINLSIYQSINLSVYQSINLSIYQSINLSKDPTEDDSAEGAHGRSPDLVLLL